MQPRPATGSPGDAEAEAARLTELGRSAEAAALLERSADRSGGTSASELRLQAAELWLHLGDADNARRQLARVDASRLGPLDAVRAMIARSELALLEGRPDEAIGALPSSPAGLPRELAARALEVRASALEALGRHEATLSDLVAREAMLRDPGAIADNQREIWRVLGRIDVTDATEQNDPILDGWLALAMVRKLAWQDPARFDEALAEWRQQYPRHPASTRFVPQMVAEQRRVATGVRAIGLILPLTGRFAAAAAAVRDGLLAAHYRSADPGRRPVIHLYDTAGNPDAAVARYQEAVEDGVDFVIGPLQKDAVTALASLAERPVPVLALNTLDTDEAPDNLYQFGLVPEEEAHQIADRVLLHGHEFGLALVPDNEFGIRMLTAFRTRFEEHGGTLLATEVYDPQQQDHSAAIIRALTIDESRARHQTLRSVLNLNLQWEPRRRRDATFIYLIGNPQQGRALRPQLRFHHASELPVYASSHVYTGVPDRPLDGDLNGVAFTDMPWTIAPDETLTASQRELAGLFGGALDRNTRLYAFGYDAYRLAPVLQHDPGLLRSPVPAATGSLYLGQNRRIHRVLEWAHFVDGRATLLR